MLKKILTSLFDSAFRSFQEWLEKKRVRTLERRVVELNITNNTLREGVLRAQASKEIERNVRALDDDALSSRMRSTRERFRKSRKR